MDNIEIRIREIIALHMGISYHKVVDKANLADDLGVDSLDAVELAMVFGEEFGIEIPDEDVEKMKTVREVITYLKEKE